MRCVRMKRVRSRSGGTVKRCAKFSGGRRKGGYRSRFKARRGRHCTRYKRVRYAGGGTVRRCVRFSGGARRRTTARRRGGYRRGHRPFNKGRRCVAYKIGKGGVRRCASFGSVRAAQRKAKGIIGARPERFTATRAAFPGLFG